jgi:hypothetical protein
MLLFAVGAAGWFCESCGGSEKAGAGRNEVRMTLEARAQRGVGRVSVIEGGVELTEAFSIVDTPAVIGAAIDERSDRNALTHGLAVEKLDRGSLVALATGGSGALIAGSKTKFVSVGGADPAGEDWNRVGSIWSSLIPAGGDGLR